MSLMHTHTEVQVFGHSMVPAPKLGDYRLVPSPSAEPGYAAIYVMHVDEGGRDLNSSVLVVGEADARRVAAGLHVLELMRIFATLVGPDQLPAGVREALRQALAFADGEG